MSVDVQIFLVYTLIVLIIDNTSDFSYVARFTAITANVKHSVCYVSLYIKTALNLIHTYIVSLAWVRA